MTPHRKWPESITHFKIVSYTTRISGDFDLRKDINKIRLEFLNVGEAKLYKVVWLKVI